MPFPLLLLLLGGMAAGATAAIIISWDQIWNWFGSNKVASTDYGELIKHHERNGQVRYISGVFDKHGKCRDAVFWEGNDDHEVAHLFHNTDRVRINI